jgi:hypothetical protein
LDRVIAIGTTVEPSLITDPALAGVLEELKRREPIFHHPELGSSRSDIEEMTAPDFWEIGASGRRYSRRHVLDVVEGRFKTQSDVEQGWQTSDFHCREIVSNVYLLTYTLLQPERRTRRSTLWKRTPTGWQILFHQGTVVQDL